MENESINISADYGVHYIAEVTYVDGGVTLHGPFDEEAEAWTWLETRAELDYKDFVGEGRVLFLNRIRPAEPVKTIKPVRTSKCTFCDEVHPVGLEMYKHTTTHHKAKIEAMGAKLGKM